MHKTARSNKKLLLTAAGFALVVTLIALFGIGRVHLPSFKPAKTPAAPAYSIHDAQSFAALTQNFHVEPPQAPELTFDIALPKDWTVDSVSSDTGEVFSKQIIGEVARLNSPYIGVHRPSLVVQTVTLKHDIGAAVWLRNYILANSYIPQGEVTAASLTRAHSAFTYIFDGKATLVQAAVQLKGGDAVLARLEVPLILQDTLGFMQKSAIETFRLAAADNKTVEEQKTYTLADLLKFSYPSSWQLAPPNLADLDRPSVQLFNKNDAGSLQGYIQIFVVRRQADSTIEQEAARLRDYAMTAIQLNIEALTGQTPLPALDRFDFTRLETYRVTSTATPSAAAQELRLIALAKPTHYTFILMLSPAEAVDLYNWGRNTRALELIAQSAE